MSTELDLDDVAAQSALAKRELDALRKDAERYHKVRRGQKWSVINGVGDMLRGDDLDAAVDAWRITTK